MKFVTLTTVRDEGAAAIAREALEEEGITVELRRVPGNPYFGGAGMNETEVRVPEEELEKARAAMAAVENQAEEAALRESAATEAPRPLPPESPRRLPWWLLPALVLTVVAAWIAWSALAPNLTGSTH